MYCSMSSHDEQLKFSLSGQLEDAIGCASELPCLKDGKVKCPAFNHFSGSVNPGDIHLPPAWMHPSETFSGEAWILIFTSIRHMLGDRLQDPANVC